MRTCFLDDIQLIARKHRDMREQAGGRFAAHSISVVDVVNVVGDKTDEEMLGGAPYSKLDPSIPLMQILLLLGVRSSANQSRWVKESTGMNIFVHRQITDANNRGEDRQLRMKLSLGHVENSKDPCSKNIRRNQPHDPCSAASYSSPSLWRVGTRLQA